MLAHVTRLLLLLLLLTAASVVWCQPRMAKHTRLDHVVFPPPIAARRPGSDIPSGHLRPLGYQRTADGEIDGRSNFPTTPEDFYNDYVTGDTPTAAIFRFALLDDIPDDDVWRTDEYLIDKYGDLNISTITKKEFKSKGQKQMPFKNFIASYKYEDIYLTTMVPIEMLHEFNLARCLKCGMVRYLEQTELMMSSGDTASLLHSHADHNLFCVLTGRTDFIFIDKKYKQKLAFHSLDYYAESGYSEIDVDRINLYTYPSIKDIPWRWATLRSRDCVYVPPGYLIQARSSGRSITTSTHWFPTPKVNFRKCELSLLRNKLPLTEVKFMWKLDNGRIMLHNDKMSGKSLRRHLLLLLRSDPFLTFKRFQAFFQKALRDERERNSAKMYWQLLTGNGSVLSRSQLVNAKIKILKDIASIFNVRVDHTTKDEL